MYRKVALLLHHSLKKAVPKHTQAVTPAKAGVQITPNKLDSRFRGNDTYDREPFSFRSF